jgi:hypothetical protein
MDWTQKEGSFDEWIGLEEMEGLMDGMDLDRKVLLMDE